jgi:hypothetical protein
MRSGYEIETSLVPHLDPSRENGPDPYKKDISGSHADPSRGNCPDPYKNDIDISAFPLVNFLDRLGQVY